MCKLVFVHEEVGASIQSALENAGSCCFHLVSARETESRCSLQVVACKNEVVASIESVLNISDVQNLKFD